MLSGRGAWTTRGMPTGGTGFYKLLSPVKVGSEPEKDFDHKAVNFGVRVIQMRVNGLGWVPRLTVDGVFGDRTDVAVRFVQGILGLSGDGAVGPKTMTALMWPPIQWDATDLARVVGGICSQESGFDPGAVSSQYLAERGPDRGIMQINESANPTITDAQAFHHRLAFQYANERIRNAIASYGSVDIAIASYNSPGWALEWQRLGTPPNAQIVDYVQKVRSWAPPVLRW